MHVQTAVATCLNGTMVVNGTNVKCTTPKPTTTTTITTSVVNTVTTTGGSGTQGNTTVNTTTSTVNATICPWAGPTCKAGNYGSFVTSKVSIVVSFMALAYCILLPGIL